MNRRPSGAPHLASIGELGVQPVDKGSNVEGQGVLKYRKLGL